MTSLAAFAEYAPPKPTRLVGVYLLMLGDEVVYVGQTTNLEQRALSHNARKTHRTRRWRMKFDRVVWVAVQPKDLLAYEGAIARAFNPRHTWRVSPDTSRDVEILEALGIPLDETRAFERRVSESIQKAWRRTKRERREWTRFHARRKARVRAFVEAA